MEVIDLVSIRKLMEFLVIFDIEVTDDYLLQRINESKSDWQSVAAIVISR